MVEFRPLTRETLTALAGLKVDPTQSRMVAPNLLTMAQAPFEPGSEIHGIWERRVPVGLIAIVDMAHPGADLDEGDDPDGIYIWRLMVDAAHQGRGHGRTALDFATGIARARGRAHLAVSALEDPGSAIPFYEAHGYRRTGRLVDGEVELVRRPA